MIDLADLGMDSARMTVKRVLQLGHRGLGNSGMVHSLVHAPDIYETDTVTDDTGTVILVVDAPVHEGEDGQDDPEPSEVDALDARNVEGVMIALERLGATDTQLIPATPGLDL